MHLHTICPKMALSFTTRGRKICKPRLARGAFFVCPLLAATAAPYGPLSLTIRGPILFVATKPKTLKRRALTARHEPGPLTYGQGRGGRPWRRLRDQIMERDGYLCQCSACKKRPVPLVAHEVDHIDNTRGPDGRLNDDPSNLQAMNKRCHEKKSQAEANRGRRMAVGQ